MAAAPPPAKRPRPAPAMDSLKVVLGGMFSAPKRLEGRVLWFNKEKGFGRIAPLGARTAPGLKLSGSSPSSSISETEGLFVHKRHLEGGEKGSTWRAIAPGALVSYVLEKGPDGKPCAAQVKCEGLAMAVAQSVPVRDLDGEHSAVREFVMSRLRFGSNQEQGSGRVIIEDRLFERGGVMLENLGSSSTQVACAIFGVFDGHAGASCSDFVSNQLDKSFFECIREQKRQNATIEASVKSAVTAAFRQTEHNFFQYANKLDGGATRSWANAGSTACVAVFFGPDEDGRLKLAVAHIGDSRAVLVGADGRSVRLTRDHTPDVVAERKRIEAVGGTVANVAGNWRVMLPSKRGQVATGLSVSRGFGDSSFKTPVELVSPVPDVSIMSIDLLKDAFLILETDGVHRAVRDEEAARVVAAALRDGSSEETAVGREPSCRPSLGAKNLVALAHGREPADDKTALIVQFGEMLPLAAHGVGNDNAGALTTGEIAGVSASVSTVSKPRGLSGLGLVPVEDLDQGMVEVDDIFGDATELELLDDIFTGYAKELGAE